MPTLPAAGPIIKVQLKHFRGTDADVLTHLYYNYSGGAPNAAALNTWCNTIVTAWVANLQAMAGSNVELVEVIATDLSSLSGARGTTSASAIGTRTGGVLPASTCVLMNMQIARRYRGGKPRVYWPYFTDTDLTSPQAWLTASLNAFNTAFNAFEAAIIASPPSGTAIVGKVNVSYYHGFTVVTNPVTGRARNVPTVRATPLIDSVFNYTLNPIPGSQRRRMRP